MLPFTVAVANLLPGLLFFIISFIGLTIVLTYYFRYKNVQSIIFWISGFVFIFIISYLISLFLLIIW